MVDDYPAFLPTLGELIPFAPVEVQERNGQLIVLSWDVFPFVRRRLAPLDLFSTAEEVYEVLGYYHEPREYVVRVFSTSLTLEDLARLAGKPRRRKRRG